MKKQIWLLLLLVLTLAACRREDPPVTTEPPETVLAPITAQTTVEATETTEPIVTEKAPDFGADVDVKYEVLTLDDEELNAILEARSADILSRYIPNISSIGDLGGTAEYDVKLSRVYKSDTLLSAVFSGSYAIYYENSEEGGDVLYTVNVDPVSGKLLETPDIVDYTKMVEAFESGRFDVKPDFSQYDPAYGLYPYVALETVDGKTRLGVYVTHSGMYEEVLGYYVSPESASDFLKIEIEE